MERKIGCSITGIGDIQNAFQAGFNYVEVRGRDLVEYTEAEFKKLVKETIRYNMPVLGVNARSSRHAVYFHRGWQRGYEGKCHGRDQRK